MASTYKWNIKSLDVKTAFLQSNEIKREVYIRPPPEAQTTDIWKLKRPAYGLGDASRLWYLTVRKKLTDIGYCVSIYDLGLFSMRDENNDLIAITIVFVDDLLVTGQQTTINTTSENLKNIFVIGAEHTNIFRYIGMNIFQNTNFEIFLDQKTYIDAIEPIPIVGSINKNPENPTTRIQQTQLRSLIGKLNWALNVSRPDIGYETRYISTILNNPQVKYIHRANKIIKQLKGEHLAIKFPAFKNPDELSLIVFSDASYGNLPNGSSQAAYIIFLTDKNFISSPLCWNSFKLKRVVSSTLSAETLALSEALDHAHLLSHIYGEVIYPDRKRIPIIALTDSNSLVEAVKTTNLSTEKRLRIEIASLREAVENKEVKIKWINNKHQLSNCLTKQQFFHFKN